GFGQILRGDRYPVRGIPVRGRARYIRDMRMNVIGVWVCAAPLLAGLPVQASVTLWVAPTVSASRKIGTASRIDDARVMLQSLRRDVAQHPGDFVVFATETG